MSHSGEKYLRRMTGQILDALVASVLAKAKGGTVDVATLRSVAEALKSNPEFDTFYGHAYEHLVEAIEKDSRIEMRRNALGRLMIHPLAPLFNDERLDRSILPNLFHFLQLSLGEQLEHYAEACADIVQMLKLEKGEDFEWDTFYAHPDARAIQAKVLWTIAKAFKNFDARREWFVKLMQYHPSSISLGAHMFIPVPKPVGNEAPAPFGRAEFCTLFQALFAPLHDLPAAERANLHSALDDFDQKRFDRFMLDLAACGV
ncbi:MAG: hypothetical protein LDL26_06225 [Caenispirillum bisanense]|nr:hypothetical protein [Caenispirillum bisanense]MCA1973054.1 hypothetical protein [Caenispirillum sp.]